MENNKRVVLTLALVAVIAVAAIGIGYAYTASTSNSGNSADIEYYKLGAKDGSTAAISTTPGDYKEKYTTPIEFDSVTESDGTTVTTTVTVNGTKIAILGKTVAKLGETTLIAFDQDNNVISPTGKTYAKLLIQITNTSATAHNVNDNIRLIAKLDNNFAAGDKANDGSLVFDGYTLLAENEGTYSGYLYVPTDEVSTGFKVILGGYLETEEGIAASALADKNMAYDSTTQIDGANDYMALYNATVKFSIASTDWIPTE